MMICNNAKLACSATALALLGGCSAFQPQAKLEIRSVQTAQETNGASSALAEGRGLLSLGQNANAISAFRAALRETPNSGDAYNGMAIAYDRIGRQDLAQRYFELAVSVDPDNDRFRGNLARLFNRTGQPKLAVGLIDAPDQQPRMAALPNPAETRVETPTTKPEGVFVAALPDDAPIQPAAPVSIELPALAAFDVAGTVEELIEAEQASEPALAASVNPVASTSIHAVYRPTAALAIRPAAIEAAQLPKPAAPRFPDAPREKLPVDLPRQVVMPVEREGTRLERVSLGEVRLVTLAPSPKQAAKADNFDSFGVRLAAWLPGAIAPEQVDHKPQIANSATLKDAIARAKIETAIDDLNSDADEMSKLASFTYAFFHGDDVEEVSLATL